MSLKSFLNQSVGVWESHRIYMYPKPGRIDYSVTNFEWTEKNGIYTIEWANAKLNSNGSMSIRIKNDFYLERSRGYFTSDVTTSEVMQSSLNLLQTHTVYNNTLFDERIEFLTNDNRFRRTIAYELDDLGNKTGLVILAGTYMENRLCPEIETSMDMFVEE